MHPGTLVVVVLGMVVLVVLSVGARVAHRQAEDDLLRGRVREGGSVIQALLPSIAFPMGSSAAVVADGAGGPVAFEALMRRLVGESSLFSSASVWVQGERSPRVVVGSAPLLVDEPDRVDVVVRRAAERQGLVVVPRLDREPRRLTYAMPTLVDGRPAVVYAEGVVGDVEALEQGDAFAGVHYAVYVGTSPTRDGLLFASTAVPLRGTTHSTSIEFGDSAVQLVMGPRHALVPGLSQELWWLVLVAGNPVVLGAALLTERLSRQRDLERRLALEIGEVAAENARLYAEQRDVAQTLQRTLLPDRLPEVQGLESEARYHAGTEGLDLGGDWYDVVDLEDGRVAWVVGDVSGRGLAAGQVMGSLRFSGRAYLSEGHGPAAMLQRLARNLDVSRDGRLATVLCGVLDLADGRLTVASAGHPRPLVLDGPGARELDVPVGLPLGVDQSASYAEATSTLAPGSTVLAFTDGLFERRGETWDVGLERVRAAAEAHASMPLAELLDALTAEVDSSQGPDDTVVLGVRWTTSSR